jgi:hypothetical protein
MSKSQTKLNRTTRTNKLSSSKNHNQLSRICPWCLREKCPCGLINERKRCSTHGCALILISIPFWKGDGSERSPHRIVAWATFWRCPRKGCYYARPSKYAAETERSKRLSGATPMRDQSSTTKRTTIDRYINLGTNNKDRTLWPARKGRRDERPTEQRSLFDV